MKGKLTVIDASGVILEVEYTKTPPLHAFQNAVGGLTEIIPRFEQYNEQECVAFRNEAGKLRGLPVNKEATVAWRCSQIRKGLKPIDDWLVGPVCIVQGDEEFMKSL